MKVAPAPGSPAGFPGARTISAAAAWAITISVAALCVLLIPVQLGWVPALRHAWAMNLWQYLPGWMAVVLAIALLALCVACVRSRPDGGASPIAGSGRGESALVRALSSPWMLLAPPLLLWMLRERRFYGDSNILLFNAASGAWFLFPDIGATYLFRLCHRVATALGWNAQSVVQAAVALAGGIAVACFLQVGQHLAWSRGSAAATSSRELRALLALGLMLGGGLTRVLAGHVEVYAFLLACAGAYLWAVLVYLHGRAHPLAPALTAGFCVWMHLSGIFLLPSLVVALWLGSGNADSCTPPGREDLGRRVRRVLWGLVVAALPVLLFLLTMRLYGRSADLEQAWRTVLRWTGIEASPVGHEAFLRGWFAEPGRGTRYVVFSPGHLKYLANAFFLLAPAALPIVVVTALRSPRRLIDTPEASVLSAASASLLFYASVVRPVWGPYDWDLFSLTAVCFAALAAHLLLGSLADRDLRSVGVLLVGATLLLVTIPYLAIGFAPLHESGPFAIDGLATQGDETPIDALERIIGPWL